MLNLGGKFSMWHTQNMIKRNQWPHHRGFMIWIEDKFIVPTHQFWVDCASLSSSRTSVLVERSQQMVIDKLLGDWCVCCWHCCYYRWPWEGSAALLHRYDGDGGGCSGLTLCRPHSSGADGAAGPQWRRCCQYTRRWGSLDWHLSPDLWGSENILRWNSAFHTLQRSSGGNRTWPGCWGSGKPQFGGDGGGDGNLAGPPGQPKSDHRCYSYWQRLRRTGKLEVHGQGGRLWRGSSRLLHSSGSGNLGRNSSSHSPSITGWLQGDRANFLTSSIGPGEHHRMYSEWGRHVLHCNQWLSRLIKFDCCARWWIVFSDAFKFQALLYEGVAQISVLHWADSTQEDGACLTPALVSSHYHQCHWFHPETRRSLLHCTLIL